MTSASLEQTAENLKNEGNALFGSRDMNGAIQKYSEAIQLTRTSPLYSNRAAAFVKLGQLDAALTDALEAIKLDPSWAKGYSRLAEVYNAQAQYGKALEAYERAMSLASGPERVRYQSLRAKMEERTHDFFYVNGAKYDPGRNGNDAMFARFEEAVPDRSKFGTDDQNLTPLGYMTAAHKLYSGWILWDSAMQHVPPERLSGPAYIPSEIIQSMTNALIQDRRGFYLRNTKEELSRISTVLKSQHVQPHILPPGTSVDEAVKTFKNLVEQRGYTTVIRNAISLTIRCEFLAGYLMHVSGHFEQSVDMMRHSIAILEALDIAFPVSQSLTASVRGATFVPSVLRGFLLLLGHIIIYGWAALPHKRSAFSLDEAESIALKVLKNLRANPLPMPPMEEPPGLTVDEWNKLRYHCHFGQYHYAEAYMILGFVYKARSVAARSSNPRSYPTNAKTVFEKSVDMYLRAASFFPDDDPEKQAALWSCLDSMLSLGGRTIGQLCELVRVAEACEDAANKFIRPALQLGTRLAIIAIVKKLEQAIGKHGSTTYLKPIGIMNETPEKLGSENDESLLARTVDKKTTREAGMKAESILGKYIKMKNDGNLCDLALVVS